MAPTGGDLIEQHVHVEEVATRLPDHRVGCCTDRVGLRELPRARLLRYAPNDIGTDVTVVVGCLLPCGEVEAVELPGPLCELVHDPALVTARKEKSHIVRQVALAGEQTNDVRHDRGQSLVEAIDEDGDSDV